MVRAVEECDVPLSYRRWTPLPAVNYLIHVHDFHKAMVQMHSVAVVTDASLVGPGGFLSAQCFGPNECPLSTSRNLGPRSPSLWLQLPA